tara:strand:- start:466 stop:858 length:393 start_codon:yes stop_codon:yes gene_type:complete
MKNNGDKISDFLDLYYTLESASPFQRFMYSTRLSFCVCLEISKSQYLNSASSFEKLCSIIPRSFGSRATIQNFLNLGLKEGFLVKHQSKNDRRVQNIKIKDEFLKYIEIWIKMHTGVFDPAITVNKVKSI